MQESLMKIENGYTLMLVAGVALAVLLIILLVILVSSMKVKTYKDRYWNTKVDNEEKTEYISALELELQEYKVKNRNNEQELEEFGKTKETLQSTSETLLTLQEQYSALEKELAQIKNDLENAQAVHAALLDEHGTLKERYDHAVEDNSRYRTNNARLLMKLESEERQTSSREERMNSYKKEIKAKIEALVRKVSAMHPQKCKELSKEDLERFLLSFSQDIIKISESVEQIREFHTDENI
ncbi:MAG TPA: hypothetical protein VLL31_04740 [Sulfurovum sp.]|nr:hypothetical protein [Sulfurovum sp.]